MQDGSHLVLIAVGPVQEFIAASRKLRDLWYGSMLLSELSKGVASALHDAGCDLVFPGCINPKSDLAGNSEMIVANKVLALCPAGSQPKEVVAQARAAWRKLWRQFCEQAVGRFPAAMQLDESMFWQQADDFGEFYGVWVPCAGDYAKACTDAEALLAARKQTRTFDAPTWNGAGHKKSSLDGVREGVFAWPDALRDTRVKRGEVLDAIGAVKRFGGRTPVFETLADVAANAWLRGVERVEGVAGTERLRRMLETAIRSAGPRNGDVSGWEELVFPHALEEFEASANEGAQEAIGAAKDVLGPLWGRLGQPSPYACYLLGDGDHMGRVIGTMISAAQHQSFSRELSTFATQSAEIVRRNHGGLVYSGGDDVMACLPLDTALTCADDLRREFYSTMHRACPNSQEVPTFSVGIVIVHMADDLSSVRRLARDAETSAKTKGGRNALCVIQDKRSGGRLEIVGKWDEADGRRGVLERLMNLERLYRCGSMPSRLGYQLRMVSATCGNHLAWRTDSTPANAAAAELARMLGRKRGKDGAALGAPDVQSILADYHDIRMLSDELVVARQLAQAKALAEGISLAQQETE